MEVAGCIAGDRVVVLGPGPIGLMIAWIARQRGCEVLLAGFRDGRRLAAATDLGIKATVRPKRRHAG